MRPFTGIFVPCPRCDCEGSSAILHQVDVDGPLDAPMLLCRWGHKRSATDAELEALKDIGIRVVAAASLEQSRRRKQAEEWGEQWGPSLATLADLQDALGDGGVVMTLDDPAALHDVIGRAVGEGEAR